ncbi:MAG: radical SAM protein [bacterium]
MKLALFLNHRCNLRCDYCYNGDKFSRRMPWDIARRTIDLALSGPRRRSQVSFFGGEPLMEMDLMKRCVDYAERRAEELDRHVRFVVTTNGTLLCGERLDFLLEHGFHMGVSLDGERRAHDVYRNYPSGRSSHSRVVQNVRETVKRYPALEVIAVVDPASAGWVDEGFEYIFDCGVRDITFNMNYEGDWTDEACDVFEAAVERLGQSYLKRIRAGHDFTCNPLDAKIITRLKEGYSCSDQCDFGCEEIAVSPTGQFYPCERLVGMDDDPKVQIGDIWDGVDPARRDALRNAKNVIPKDCAGCVLQGRCMYWCGCVNYATTGRVDGVTGELCWMEQLFIRTADRVASTLYKEENPIFLEKYYLSAGSALARREAAEVLSGPSRTP